jgi:hypothetical protein
MINCIAGIQSIPFPALINFQKSLLKDESRHIGFPMFLQSQHTKRPAVQSGLFLLCAAGVMPFQILSVVEMN